MFNTILIMDEYIFILNVKSKLYCLEHFCSEKCKCWELEKVKL